MAVIAINQPIDRTARDLSSEKSVAAASGPQRVDQVYIVVGLILLAAGVLIASWAQGRSLNLTLKPGISVFALFFIGAQALERLFELLQLLWPSLGSTSDTSGTISKDQAVRKRDVTLAKTITEPSESHADAVAQSQALVERIRLNRTFLAWTTTATIGMVASAYLNLKLISTIADGPDSTVFAVVDIFVTGLVIGGGTKPLHDLIANLQESKTRKEDPAR